MDAELRAQIVAVFERQARRESVARLNMVGSANPNAGRNLALTCAGIVLLAVGAGAGLFAVGWSYGGDARMAELCQGDAVRDQGTGVACSFWMVPSRQAQRPTPKG